MLRPGVPPPGVRLPPGPPVRPPLRMPPGPPPGIPPVLGAVPGGARMPPMPRPLLGGGLRNAAPALSAGVVSAAPQLIPKESNPVAASASATSNAPVIESKPQIRNLLSDVTRYDSSHLNLKMLH